MKLNFLILNQKCSQCIVNKSYAFILILMNDNRRRDNRAFHRYPQKDKNSLGQSRIVKDVDQLLYNQLDNKFTKEITFSFFWDIRNKEKFILKKKFWATIPSKWSFYSFISIPFRYSHILIFITNMLKIKNFKGLLLWIFYVSHKVIQWYIQ